jgi:hypothetical protein
MQGLSNYAQVSGHYYEAVRDYNLAVAGLVRASGNDAPAAVPAR